ncbi:hypothetical protein BA724_02990 [Domibacillus iocasae]|uniref:Uncharacterized protein n=1 Tax=Domibacillus iocasae TaxID=1714016 RepID=A0A1E7DRU1_9BACI|nr:hypothetical protein BA724_02990 [Domibacillus iocasae]
MAVEKEIEYKPLETKTNVDPHYDFTVKFNNDLNAATIRGSNIYVKTNSTTVQEVKFSLNAYKRKLLRKDIRREKRIPFM